MGRSRAARMIPKNSTVMTEFILAGITDDPQLQIPLFLGFTLICLLTLVGNLGVVTLILLDSRLHTPMYFFLSHLSLADFGCSTAVTPKVMAGLLVGDKVISYKACAAQFFFFAVFLIMESSLLASMAYDRHAAVCKPLHYTNIMTTRVCAWIVIGFYVLGFLEASVHTWNTVSLSADPMWLITFSEMLLPSWLSRAQTATEVRSLYFFWLASMLSFLTWSSWSPICLSLSRFWGCAHLKGIRRPFPPALPTSLLSPSFMGQHPSCTYKLAPATPWTQTKWRLCSTPWSSPGWTTDL